MTNSRHRNTRIFAEKKDDEICISGISGNFPKARNVHELEHKLYNKVGIHYMDLIYWAGIV